MIVYLMWILVMSNPKLYLNPLLHVAGSGEYCWWWTVLDHEVNKENVSSVIALSCDNVATFLMLRGCQGQWENWRNRMIGHFNICEREAVRDDLSGHYCLRFDTCPRMDTVRDYMLPLFRLSRLGCVLWGKPMYYNNNLWGQKLAMCQIKKPRQC